MTPFNPRYYLCYSSNNQRGKRLLAGWGELISWQLMSEKWRTSMPIKRALSTPAGRGRAALAPAWQKGISHVSPSTWESFYSEEIYYQPLQLAKTGKI